MPVAFSLPAFSIPDANAYERLTSLQSIDRAACTSTDAASAHSETTGQAATCFRLLKQSADAFAVTGSFIRHNAAPLVSGLFLAASVTGLGIGFYGTFNPQSGPFARYAYYDGLYGEFQNSVAFGVTMGSMLATIISGASLVAQLCHTPEHQQIPGDQAANIEMQSREPGNDNTPAAAHSTSVGTQTDHVTVEIQALTPASADDSHVVLTIRPENSSSSAELTMLAGQRA